MNLLDVIFPKRCVGCGKIGRYVCDQCSSIIRIIELNEAICPVCEKQAIDGATHPKCKTRYSLDGLTSFFRYDGVAKNAIKAIKYRFVSDLASEFVSLIPMSSCQVTKYLSNQVTIVVPIPLHPSRFRERGFNQAEVMGGLLSQRLKIPLRRDILCRTRRTVPQVEMKDRKKRLQNMENVFAIHDSVFDIQKSRILLFDDVFTTGATMRAAAHVLKRAGVRWIWGVTIAR